MLFAAVDEDKHDEEYDFPPEKEADSLAFGAHGQIPLLCRMFLSALRLNATFDQNRDEDYEAVDRVLPKGRYPQHRKSLLQDAQEEAPRKTPGTFPPPPDTETPPITQAAMTVIS